MNLSYCWVCTVRRFLHCEFVASHPCFVNHCLFFLSHMHFLYVSTYVVLSKGCLFFVCSFAINQCVSALTWCLLSFCVTVCVVSISQVFVTTPSNNSKTFILDLHKVGSIIDTFFLFLLFELFLSVIVFLLIDSLSTVVYDSLFGLSLVCSRFSCFFAM